MFNTTPKKNVDIPVVTEVVDNDAPTPILLKSGKIIEIDNSDNPFMLTWAINNVCTNHCSYCHPNLHAGSNHHYNWLHAKKFIKECFNRYKNVHCNLSGGEPTVSPFFKDLVNLIHENNGTIHLTTNLIRPIDYWTDIANKFASICVSYHSESILTEEQEDEFIEKINYIGIHTSVTTRVMMFPKNWDRCYNFYEKLVKSIPNCGIEMVRLQPDFGTDHSFFDADYTLEQELILSSTMFVNNPVNFKNKVNAPTIIFESGASMKLNASDVNKLENNKLSNFKNWSCDVGLESLFVRADGEIVRGNCSVGGVVGNITKFEQINWPNNSITCTQSLCGCAADVVLSKRIPGKNNGQ